MHIHCSDFLLQGARLTDSPSGWALNWSLCQSHCPHGFCQPTTKWVTCTDTDLFPSSRGFFWWVMLVLEFLTDLLQALEAKWRLRISMSTLLSSLPSSLWSDLNCTFFFWPRCVACGIFIPWPGIEPPPLHWKLGILATDHHGSPPELYSQSSSCVCYCLPHLPNRPFPQYLFFHIYTYRGVCLSEDLN